MIDWAERMETSCSVDRPPKRTPMRSRLIGPSPFETAGIDQTPRRIARRILEGAPQAALFNRLRLAPVPLHLLDAVADPRRIVLSRLERRGQDDPSRLS